MPPHYNARRQYQLPIPSINAYSIAGTSNMDANASVSTENGQRNSTADELNETGDNFEDDVDNDLLENAQDADVESSVSGISSLNTSTMSGASNMDANASEIDQRNSTADDLNETGDNFEGDVDNGLMENAQAANIDNDVSGISSLNTTMSVASNIDANASVSAEIGQQNSIADQLNRSGDNFEHNVDNGLMENAQAADVESSVSGAIVPNEENTIAVTEQSVIAAESRHFDANGGKSNHNVNAETDMNVSQPTRGTQNDFKHVLEPVNIDADDENAIRNLLNDLEKSSEANDNIQSPADSLASISLGCGETAEIINGEIIVTRKYDDGLEMTYTYGTKPTLLPPQYQIKINDSVTGNIPFKENEGNDRAYIVRINNRFEEKKIAAVVVEVLKCFNDGENRKNSGLDCAFVKTLVIALCTKNAIKNGAPIHKDVKIFIKGLKIFVNSVFQ